MEEVNFKDKTVLFVDTGLFIEIAIKLSKRFKEVYYWTPWQSGYPSSLETTIGKGIPGIIRVLDFWDILDKIDLCVFPDVGFGGLQVHLEKLGKRVWGSRNGEMLELDRIGTKELMIKLGLPVQPVRKITGMAKLREYLKTHNNKYIKIDIYRGDFETFRHDYYALTEPRLDDIEHRLGARKYITEFIVEDDLPNRVEVGYDGTCIDGKYLNKTLVGIEIKGEGYIGIFKDYSELPKEITGFNEAMSATFKQFGYRGFMSTEIRVGKDHKGYMIDLCARSGSPPNEVYQEMYSNLAEMIWYGSEGILVDPIPMGKWAVEVLIHSEWAMKNWQPIEFPEKYRNNIKLRSSCYINNQWYVVPQGNDCGEIGAIIVVDDDLETAIKKVREIAETVKGYYIEIPLHALDKAQEEMKKSEEYNIKIF